MFIRRNIGNRLIPTIIAVACLMKRACAVNEPRFTYVDFLRKKTGGSEPENFGTVYRDETTRKEYLVEKIFAPLEGKEQLAIFSIREIVSRPAGEHYFTEATFKQTVVLKTAGLDVENDMITFFQEECKKKGRGFLDKRM